MHYMHMCYKCLPYESKIASILNLMVGRSVGCPLNYPLFQYLKGVGYPLSCLLSCPLYSYMDEVGTPTEKTGELPTSLPIGCTWATEWAAHGNFAMQIRLPTTSIYGNSEQLSGQLSRQPTTSKYEKSGQLSGLPMGCPWEFCHVN